MTCAKIFQSELNRRFLCWALVGLAQMLSTLFLHALPVALPVPVPPPPPPPIVSAAGGLAGQTTTVQAAGPGTSSTTTSAAPCQITYTRTGGGQRENWAGGQVAQRDWRDPTAAASVRLRRLHSVVRALLALLGALVGGGTLLWTAFARTSPPPAPLVALLIGASLGLLEHPLSGLSNYVIILILRVY